jgi:hypothetical protein
MNQNHLKLLEARINKAIQFIENLRSREKNLVQEKEEQNKKIGLLQKELKEKEKRIEELLGSQEFLKEKIESILSKLESFASIGSLNYGQSEPSEEDKESGLFQTGEHSEEQEEVIIEDSIVDLQENSNEEKGEDKDVEEADSKTDTKKTTMLEDNSTQLAGTSGDSSYEDENLLFKSESETDTEALHRVDKDRNYRHDVSGNNEARWFENNPFIET